MNTVNEDNMTVLQQNEVGLIRTLSFCIFDHSDDKITSSFHSNSIEPKDFDDF